VRNSDWRSRPQLSYVPIRPPRLGPGFSTSYPFLPTGIWRPIQFAARTSFQASSALAQIRGPQPAAPPSAGFGISRRACLPWLHCFSQARILDRSWIHSPTALTRPRRPPFAGCRTPELGEGLQHGARIQFKTNPPRFPRSFDLGGCQFEGKKLFKTLDGAFFMRHELSESLGFRSDKWPGRTPPPEFFEQAFEVCEAECHHQTGREGQATHNHRAAELSDETSKNCEPGVGHQLIREGPVLTSANDSIGTLTSFSADSTHARSRQEDTLVDPSRPPREGIQ
jgi:hypothetical protein